MSEFELDVPVNTRNRDPRIACALVVDVSSSMSGEPIAALTEGYQAFIDAVQNDPLARKRAEISVITFGTSAQVLVPFQEAQDLTPTRFLADGSTDMAGGINLALDELEARKAQYKAEDLEYFRPWLFLMTDGGPTTPIDEAIDRLNRAESSKKVAVFAVGVGGGVNWEILGRVGKRSPLKLNGLAFTEMFEWLSASLTAVSESSAHGPGGDAGGPAGEQIALPAPTDWGSPY